MEISVKAEDLLGAYGNVSRAIPVRTTIGVIDGVLINADDKTTLTATDTDFRVEQSVESDNKEKGKAVVPSRVMNMLRSLPKDEFVTIKTTEDKVEFDCLGSHIECIKEDPDEFPKGETVKGVSVVMPSETLEVMVDGTSFAASQDEGRGIITGCLFKLEDKKVSMVGIDGFRMAICEAEILSDSSFSVAINAGQLKNIARLLSDDEVTVNIGDKTAEFVCGDVRASARLMAGNFPDYKSIIPTEHKGVITVNRDAVMPSLERAVMITENAQKRLVKLDIKDSLKIAARGELGLVDETVEAVKEGDDILIGFNGGYLLQGLKNMSEGDVRIEYKAPLSPIMMTQKDYQYIVLPVRL